MKNKFFNKLSVWLLLMPLQMANGQNRIVTAWQNMPQPEHRLVAGIHSGMAYLLASTDNNDNSMIEMGIQQAQASDFNKKSKHGWRINGDIYYMFSDNIGLGAEYSLFTSSVQKDFTIERSMQHISMTSQYVHAGMTENLYIHYAGPSVIYRRRLDENQKIQLTGTLSAGYVHYRKETRTDPNRHDFNNSLNRDNTWGANAGVSAEYFPISRLSVGISAGFMYARLTKIDVQTKETSRTVVLAKKNYQSLARLDYSLGIRFHFLTHRN